jgi:NAD(P)-dependent dehydrogenase (short-subunit alcohol dehydrogenase family)
VRLRDRRALVLGTGSRIGAACAEAFRIEGADVLGLEPDPGEPGARAVAAACGARWPAIDVLMTCTAVMDPPGGAVGLEAWRAVLEVNLLGPVAQIEALLPMLAASGSASVVLLGSIDGLLANPNVPAYSVSKAALGGLTRALAARHAAAGIRFNCIATGGIFQTPAAAPAPTLPAADPDLILRTTPLHRLPTPEEVAAAAVFLASPESAYITGSVLVVDGGRISTTPGTLLS